jgi:hypothetical protein
MAIGKPTHNQCTIPDPAIDQTKPIKIFNKICPDIILANNRIAKLKISR